MVVIPSSQSSVILDNVFFILFRGMKILHFFRGPLCTIEILHEVYICVSKI